MAVLAHAQEENREKDRNHRAGGAVYYDVATGTDGSRGTICMVGSGYDFVTGLGSPRVGIDTALAGAP